MIQEGKVSQNTGANTRLENDPEGSNMDRQRAQKTKSEHEHASENAPEKKQEHIRNGGQQVKTIDEKCSPEGARRVQNGGLEHVPPKWAPGVVQVAPGGGPGAPTIHSAGPGPPRGDKLIDFRVPGQGSGELFWELF